MSKHIQAKHQGTDYDEALNECVGGQLKFKNYSVLSKHILSKHQAFVKKLATRAERLENKFGVAPVFLPAGSTEIISQEFQAIWENLFELFQIKSEPELPSQHVSKRKICHNEMHWFNAPHPQSHPWGLRLHNSIILTGVYFFI